jgi:hypothetical protein
MPACTLRGCILHWAVTTPDINLCNPRNLRTETSRTVDRRPPNCVSPPIDTAPLHARDVHPDQVGGILTRIVTIIEARNIPE